MIEIPARKRTTRGALSAVAAVVATLLLGACASIPERAIVNGRALGPQVPLQMRSMRDMSELRGQYYQAQPLKVYQRPYQPFGVWPR